jgi:hypothetical protein
MKYSFIHKDLIVKKNIFIDKNSGYDKRNITFKENNIKLENINKNLFKKQILDILLDNNVDINIKINLIEKYDIIKKKPNDLMKYFD